MNLSRADVMKAFKHQWAIGAIAAFFASILAVTPFGRGIDLAFYDRLVAWGVPGNVMLPVTLIAIDDRTYWELNIHGALPRNLHAKLLGKLREADVAVVAFDLPLSGDTVAEHDAAFAEAIKAGPAVVLASDTVVSESASVREWRRVEPATSLVAAGSVVGNAELDPDQDGLVRKLPVQADSFVRQIVSAFDRVKPGVVEVREPGADLLIGYMGPPGSFTSIPYHHMLDPEKHLSWNWRDFLRNNIVIVGRVPSGNTGVVGVEQQVFQTPTTAAGRLPMSRIEIAANGVTNLVAGNVIYELGWISIAAAWLIFASTAAAFVWKFNARRGAFLVAVLTPLPLVIEAVLFLLGGIWLPLVWLSIALTLAFAVLVALPSTAQGKHFGQRDRLAARFPPDIVAKFERHPESLGAVAERTDVTILVAGLGGLSVVSETPTAQRKVEIANRYFDECCQAILDCGGAIDRIVGTNIVAYWGAPIPDSRSSARAVEAAKRIFEATNALKVECRQSDDVSLRLSVGVHRGSCLLAVVGNRPSREYSLLGDPVYFAEQLRAANRIYGTEILLGESVGAEAGRVHELREVDLVAVEGGAVQTLYSTCEVPDLVTGSARVLDFCRRGEHQAAESAWQDLHRQHPTDSVARAFAEHLAQRGQGESARRWRGLVTMVAG